MQTISKWAAAEGMGPLRLNGEKPFRYLWSAVRSSMLADMCHTALGVNALFINPEERRTVNTNREEVWLREVVWLTIPLPLDSLVTVDLFHLCMLSLCVINHWTLSMWPVLFQSNYFLMSHLSKSHSDKDWYCCKMYECAFLGDPWRN